MKTTFRSVVLGLLIPLAIGCQRAPEWVGEVSVSMREGAFDPQKGQQFTIVVVLSSSQGDYALVTPPDPNDLELIGLEMKSGSVSWKSGKQYRVRGSLVTDEAQLAAAKALGLSGAIIATRIELLGESKGTENH